MRPGPTALLRLVDEYLAGRRARGEIGDRTAVEFRSTLSGLTRSFGDRPVAELDRHAIFDWQATIGHWKPATRRSYLSTVKGFAGWLVVEGHLTADPTLRMARVREPRRIPRALSATQVARVLAVCQTDRDRVTVALMLWMGLRACEVAGLSVADYDPDAATVFIVGKADHERILPVPAEAAEIVDRYIDGRTTGPLVRSQRGREINPINPSTISIYVSPVQRRRAETGTL